MQIFDGFPLRYDTIPSERLVDLRLYFRVLFKTQLTFRTVSLGETKTFCRALLIALLFQRIFFNFIYFLFLLDIVSSTAFRTQLTFGKIGRGDTKNPYGL